MDNRVSRHPITPKFPPIPSYRRRGTNWRAEVYKDGARESGTFPTKQAAVAWATQREAEMVGAKLPDHTLKDALRRFAGDVSAGRKGKKWEQARLKLLERDELAPKRLAAITRTDVADLRDRRLQVVTGASVRREMTHLISVFEHCAGDWGWLRPPARGVKRPEGAPPRRRHISLGEIDRVTMVLGQSGETWPRPASGPPRRSVSPSRRPCAQARSWA